MTCYKRVSLKDEIETWFDATKAAYMKVRILLNDERKKRDGFNANMETICIDEIENLGVCENSEWYEKLTLYVTELPTMDITLLNKFDSRSDMWPKRLAQYAREAAASDIRERFLVNELRALDYFSLILIDHLKRLQFDVKDDPKENPEIDTVDILDSIFSALHDALYKADYSESLLLDILKSVSSMKGMEELNYLYETDPKQERNWTKHSSKFTIDPALIIGKVKTVISKFTEMK